MGKNIIQSDCDLNENIGYFIPGNSIYRVFISRITFYFAWRLVPIEINCELYIQGDSQSFPAT
jgi:hypothetical protein